MALGVRERIAYRMFGRLAEARYAKNPALGLALQRAHIPLRPEVYLASAYFTAAVVAVLTAFVAILLALAAAAGVVSAPAAAIVPLAFAPVILGGFVFALALV